MVTSVIGKSLFFGITPTRRPALVCVLETDYVIYVDKVARFARVKANVGIGFVAAVVEVRAVIAPCNGN
jgi:hypothetical protein